MKKSRPKTRREKACGASPRRAIRQASPLVLDQFLPYRLAVLSNNVSRALGEVYGDRFQLTIAEWRVMANLGHFGPLYAGALAERSSMDKPKVTRALQSMETSGLVIRTIDNDDRRQARISLTQKGVQMFRDVAVIALEWERRLLTPLSPSERRMFELCLQKLDTSIDVVWGDHKLRSNKKSRREVVDEAL